MKYDDLDSYIENLFQQPERHGDTDLSGFDDRLSNVEDAILDAYESAMRWHSAQIAPGGDQPKSEGESTTLDSSASLGYEYWNEESAPPTSRHAPARPKPAPKPKPSENPLVVIDGKPVRLKRVTLEEAEIAMNFTNSQSSGLTCGEILAIAAAIVLIFFLMVVLS